MISSTGRQSSFIYSFDSADSAKKGLQRCQTLPLSRAPRPQLAAMQSRRRSTAASAYVEINPAANPVSKPAAAAATTTALDLRCLDGVRAVATAWVVALHTSSLWGHLVEDELWRRLLRGSRPGDVLVRCGGQRLACCPHVERARPVPPPTTTTPHPWSPPLPRAPAWVQAVSARVPGR